MTTMQRFDPFQELRHISRLLNNSGWAGQRWGAPLDSGAGQPVEAFSIPMDMRRDDRQLTVHASLPGFAPGDVDVTISPARTLTIRASRQTDTTDENAEFLLRERRSGSFARAIRLPGDLDLDAAAVSLEHGVLTVTAPVAAAAQTRRLSIGSAPVGDAAVTATAAAAANATADADAGANAG